MIITKPDDDDEPPPSYTPPEPGPSTPRTFPSKPTNFVALFDAHDAVRGEFAIDPSMTIPAALLAPLEDGQCEADRKNLALRSHSGSVRAEVWLLGRRPGAGADKPVPRPGQRTTLAFASESGSVDVRVTTLDDAAPFWMTATSKHGTVRVSIPERFQGLLSLSTRHGSVSLSDAVLRNATMLGQHGDVRRYFVGDFGLLTEDPWCGDEVVMASVHGSVRLKYVDDESTKRQKKGLLGRLFGK